LSIYVNSKIDFVFAQRNAETAFVSKTKGFKAGDRLFLWRKVGLMGSGAADVRCRVERLLIYKNIKKS
jgi:hypothetical protein